VGDTFRWIRSGAADELTPLRRNETWIRVDRVLPEDAWTRVADLLSSRPDVQLSIEAGEDLEMLRGFPGLRRLAARSLRLRSLDGLRHVAGSLEELTLGDTLKRLSMRAVGDLPRLRRLAVNGSWKDVDTVSRLVGLERLGIGSVDLEWLRPLTGLRRFECGLGTIAHVSILDEIGRLEMVELWRLRGEHDLSSLGRISTLRYLVLDSTRSVTALPSLAACRDLRWVSLSEMRGITDLQPVADAPNLEVLLLVGMNQLDAGSLRPFIGHPALRAGIWGFGSKRRNEAAQALLPLSPAPGASMAPWNDPGWDGIRHPTQT
jgi:hypothetical protein